jgi:DNA polymerase kappa
MEEKVKTIKKVGVMAQIRTDMKFFPSSPKKPESSAGPSRQSEAIDMTILDDDDDGYPKPDTRDGSVAESPPPAELDPSPSQGPLCPICNRMLHASTTNAELNEHIDLCLNRDAFGDMLPPEPNPEPSRKRHASETPSTSSAGKRSLKKSKTQGKPPMLDMWLKRSNK